MGNCKLTAVLVVLLSVAPAVSDALTVDEAVQLALEHNHRVREYENLVSAERERVESRRAPFLPHLGIGYSFSRRDNIISTFQTRESSALSGELSFNLFNGLGDLRELRAQEAALEAAEYQQRAVVADVELAVKTAYIDLLRNGRNMEAEKEAVELLERQRRETALFLREGLVAKNELLRVDVELATARQGLTRVTSNHRVAGANLERLVGVSVDLDDVKEVPRVSYPDLDLYDLKLTMYSRRSELNYLRALKQSREYKRDAIYSGYVPAIDLSLTHSRYGDNIFPEGRDNLFDTDTVGAVAISWTLYDGARRARDARALDWEVESITEHISDLEEEMLLQLVRAHENYIVAQERLDVAEKAVEQAEENYRITESQVRERAATVTDLLDARVFLTRARLQHNDVIYDLAQSIAGIERVVEAKLETVRH